MLSWFLELAKKQNCVLDFVAKRHFGFACSSTCVTDSREFVSDKQLERERVSERASERERERIYKRENLVHTFCKDLLQILE